MRTWNAAATILLAIFSTTLSAHDWPEKVPATLARAYAPLGFDSDDLTQIVVTGSLSLTCLREGTADTRVDTAAKIITVSQFSYRYPNACLPIRIPYSRVLDIGILPQGAYTIVDGASGKKLGNLEIAPASSNGASGLIPGVDDYFYALVQDAFIWRKPGDTFQLTLDYRLPKGAKLKDVHISYSKDAIVVQPIAEIVTPFNFQDEYTSGRVTVPLRTELEGTVLLHVRSMSGRALNKLVDL